MRLTKQTFVFFRFSMSSTFYDTCGDGGIDDEEINKSGFEEDKMKFYMMDDYLLMEK